MSAAGRSEPMPATRAGAAAAWRPTLLVLLPGLLLWGLLFRAEIAQAIGVWRGSTAYGHCFLVLPVAAWLAWRRREALAGVAPAPSATLALLAAAPALAWLAAERLGVMEGRQFAAIGVLWALLLACLGWPVTRRMLAPLGYLVFLVPFGAFLVPPLQRLTATMIEAGLSLMGTPFYAEGMLIETPAGTFHVAEACAGLRFLTASLAFGVFFALEMFRSPWRRLAVVAIALVVPVLANGARAFGVVALAQHLGSAEAAAADHLVYGWGFFAVILLLLVGAGLALRDGGALAPRRAARQDDGAAPGIMRAGIAAALALLLPATVQAAAAGLRDAAAAPRPTTLALAPPPGCSALGETIRCDDATVTARLVAFSPRSTWSAVTAARGEASGADDLALTFTLRPPGDLSAWQVRSAEANRAWVATMTALGGAAVGDGLAARARQGWNSIAGGQGAPVLAVLELRAAEQVAPARARRLLGAILAAQVPTLGSRARLISVNWP